MNCKQRGFENTAKKDRLSELFSQHFSDIIVLCKGNAAL